MSALRGIARNIVMARARKKADKRTPGDGVSPGRFRRFTFSHNWSMARWERYSITGCPR